MDFEFTTSSKIIFKSGAIEQIGGIAKSLGNKALIITGGGSVDIKPIVNELCKNKIDFEIFKLINEPDINTVNNGIDVGRSTKCDLVIGIGGGSVIDTGKAISAMMNNPGQLFEYLEIVGFGRKIKNIAIPYIAVPTTSGTGSEVTKNSVIKIPEHNVKVSLRSELIIPSIALIDPMLTLSMPPKITAITGMDALTQVIEPFVSKRSNQFVDEISKSGIKHGSNAIIKAYENGSDIEARTNMSYMSLMGGISLANAGLGAVHGFAGPIGGMFDIPHGMICAALLPHVIEVNIMAMNKRDQENIALIKYDSISKIILRNDKGTVKDLNIWMNDLLRTFWIPTLSEIGLNKNDLPNIVNKSKNSSSMKSNPIKLEDHELMEILERAF